MIHGNRQARAATQSRAVIVLGALLAVFVAAALATGAGYVEFEVPWKGIAVLAVTALVLGFNRLRR